MVSSRETTPAMRPRSYRWDRGGIGIHRKGGWYSVYTPIFRLINCRHSKDGCLWRTLANAAGRTTDAGANMSRTQACCYFGLIWSLFGVFSGVLGAPRARNLYTDSGYTRQNDAMDRLSQLFGIKRIPPNFRHKTPPEYMTALYKSVAYEDGITKSAAPYDADVVRGFPDRGMYEGNCSLVIYQLHMWVECI